jgi:phage terminase Nu1 subunit (DNA packaging protein)
MNAKDEAAIEALKRDVDRTLLRENLKLTLEQCVQKHLRAAQMMEELQRAGIRLRAGQKTDGR